MEFLKNYFIQSYVSTCLNAMHPKFEISRPEPGRKRSVGVKPVESNRKIFTSLTKNSGANILVQKSLGPSGVESQNSCSRPE